MNVIATALKHLIAAGMTGDALVSAIAEIEEAQALCKPIDAAAERKRAYDREYQAERRRNRTMSYDSHDGTTQKKDPQTPKENTPLNGSPKGNLSPQPKRASRLPDGFMVPDEWLDWAKAKRRWSDAEVRDEAACFCRYWQAKSGKDATKLDWEKTWRNWVVNSKRPTGATTHPVVNRSMNRVELQAAIAFAEDHNDPERAAELKRQLAKLTERPPDPAVAALTANLARQLHA